ELAPQRSFREADAQLLEDDYPAGSGEERHELRRRLTAAFEKMLPRIKDSQDLFNQLAVNNISLGTLTDVITFALDLDVRAKQSLLAQPNVDARARLLLEHLKRTRAAETDCLAAGFPPAFSTN
ncbi:MAG TPA: LON peptidase substrate-binding domain-containing protein, partial [Pirellulales bacterium]|nr:LON peptidase substrate-binding domain-containing protein [Pirellulales bacterium]